MNEPNFAPWQWLLGIFSALAIGVAKTGLPGLGSFVAPLMVLTVGDARYAATWTRGGETRSSALRAAHLFTGWWQVLRVLSPTPLALS